MSQQGKAKGFLGDLVDMPDDWIRELGKVDLSRVLGAVLAHANPVIMRVSDGSAFFNPLQEGEYIYIYGGEDQKFPQESVSPYQQEISVYGKYQATPITLTDGDVGNILLDSSGRLDVKIGSIGTVTFDMSDRAARLVGVVYGESAQLQQLTPADAVTPANSLEVTAFTMVYNGSTWDMVREGASAGSFLVDSADRAARLVGVVYGSQAQQLQQKASTYELLVDSVDRAARLLGVVYGSQSQQLQQKASTYELLVDPVDRAARLVGVVYGETAQLQQLTPADAVTPVNSLETTSFLEIFNGTNWDRVREGASAGSILTDPADRAARLVGIVYGDEGQQLAQEAASPYELQISINQDNIGLALESGGNLATIAGKDFSTETTLAKIPQVPTTVLAGTKTVSAAATPEALATSTTVLNSILIQALNTNGSDIFVGNVTAQEIRLSALESVVVVANDLANVYIRVSTNGEGCAYVAA